jgi:hypothetical protein
MFSNRAAFLGAVSIVSAALFGLGILALALFLSVKITSWLTGM